MLTRWSVYLVTTTTDAKQPHSVTKNDHKRLETTADTEQLQCDSKKPQTSTKRLKTATNRQSCHSAQICALL